MQAPRVIIASDSYKGSATSREVDDLIEQGVRRACPDAAVRKFPIADGGEGTVDALVSALEGEERSIQVRGPLGEPVVARYGLVRLTRGLGLDDMTGKANPAVSADDIPTAILEMAQSSGITLIEQNEENALAASTYGVGEMILDALDQGARRLCIGLGGSATSDGGTGMARALGARFLDAEGREVPDGLAGLSRLAAIDVSGLDSRIAQAEVIGLTDVSNPLTGPAGAVFVYGPQKGVPQEELAKADAWMQDYAALLACLHGADIAAMPGAGAAGGLGAGLLAFCGARLVSGIDFVLDAIGLEQAAEEADLVITGEGRMDAQSANGKAPVGVACRAKRHGLPVIAVVGSRADDLGAIYEAGIDLVIPAVGAPQTLDEALAHASTNVPNAAETAMRAYLLGRRPEEGAGRR